MTAYDCVKGPCKIGHERIDQLHLDFVVHGEVVKGIDDDRRLV